MAAPIPGGCTRLRTEMPKNKSHSGTSKRVKVTGSGKLIREKTGKRHKLEKKSSKLTRRLSGTTDVSKHDVPRLKKLLGL
ncbi:50S ribosomal protein L35 [Saccharothrix stipae]